MSEFRLDIIPAVGKDFKVKSFVFNSREAMEAAHNVTANLLLYMQDELGVMPPYSNSFTQYEKVDGEWVELYDQLLEGRASPKWGPSLVIINL